MLRDFLRAGNTTDLASKRPADCGIVNHDTVVRSQARRFVIPSLAMRIDDSLPTDLASAHALIIAKRQALSAAEQRATAAESEAQYRALLIEKLKFTIRKLRHDRFGQSLERGALLDQLELQLADLEADAAHADTAAQMVAAASEKVMVPSFERRRPARRLLPEHLPRERTVYLAARQNLKRLNHFGCLDWAVATS
jgi:transposase